MANIPGFTRQAMTGDGVQLSVQMAGEGPALVLIHGYPENGMCWLNIAPELARHFRVIIPDLRGYGQSDSPADDAAHTTYSKRQMARDIVVIMDHLNIPRAMVLGHDRGARVTYRLALDHPNRVSRIGIVEIAPTAEYWAAWGAELALAAYHWTFLSQPAPLPERMINADPVAYIDWTLASWTLAKSLAPFPNDALQTYREQARDPARIHAMCADYRAGATTDRQHDEADLAAAKKITAPLHFLWGHHGFPAKSGDPVRVWRKWATTVTDNSCESGHFVMEENPKAVLDSFLPFFLAR